ncbi:glycoside hydrolase family 43 protein [Paenibacillus donghaensis]|uniref:Glycoside hydrolase n=1 Tax=Paenibacillus donghaensis TaxID=414771 RepID=A0A2Z2KDH8_9BACL|nr:glycoside hydrolase 43 family protein [Paenibacillus donghaensis]ASA24034.1 glycoside hydrolase [Paenibacillus donghaensis]
MNTNRNDFPWGPWTSDQGDGTFVNPVLYADYSDPDVIRVGEDFYMTASSFGHIPGLPILHSKDLVNWRLINHALPRMPFAGYDSPQHGNGVWAPSLRYHDNKFWIFYGDPDIGILMLTAEDPAGRWSELHLVHKGKGLIDTCPFWDDDGKAYLVHAYAHSRSGIKHRLRICGMSPDGKSLLDEGISIIDDPIQHNTIEGPKMYKRNGYYYVFAPAGGVEEGWQTVLRSSKPCGPYESRIVLKQGETSVNGPHQGGWVELESGESWFMHFQHKDAYGRIVHLQPVTWVEDWPHIGENVGEDGSGEPVAGFRKPATGATVPLEAPSASDTFIEEQLGLQWQWQANPEASWYSLNERPGYLRLFALPVNIKPTNTLFQTPQLLLQKFPAPAFAASTRLEPANLQSGSRAGLMVFGYSYAALVCIREEEEAGGWRLQLVEGNAETEQVVWEQRAGSQSVILQVDVEPGGQCSFRFSLDGEQFESIDRPRFQAVVSKWVGAKVGLFATSTEQPGGYADFGWFKVAGLS